MSTYRRAAVSALADADQVVADPLRFKAKLAIGENAYTSLRLVNRARELWDVLGAGATGAAVAKSTLVASTFFAPSGILGAIGIGTAATPIGWVALAALASGGACYGVYRLLGDSKGARVIEIPRFLNTPLDTLGLAIFDLISPLALRLAAVDGVVEEGERQALIDHMVDDWGLDRTFVVQAVSLIETDLRAGSLQEVASELSAFLHQNPDCNHETIATELGVFLRSMLEASGPLSQLEEQALADCIELILTKPNSKLIQAMQGAGYRVGAGAEKVGSVLGQAADWSKEHMPTPEQLQAGARHTKDTAVGVVSWASERLPTANQLNEAAKRSALLVSDAVKKLKKRGGGI
ncbi:hypothetical protein [Roseateles toxinivorans]|uniref:Tellurite resistance protein TerB n=1 Tax=Roseateles toxinivorans TaxID=270368 RepID=A0A4R6QSV7_9BURK|nr:hypothetical protein [Roseateles toxinivorans]TDP74730.1 hypothetical protein DES47_101796 [Roseateles toxinivorans]